MSKKIFTRAKWIWLDYTTPWAEGDAYRAEKVIGLRETEKNRWGLFRKQFELPEEYQPETAVPSKLYISVDSRYKLFINGKYIGRGVYRCNRFNWYYDEYDVSQILRPGLNVICIIAQFFGEDMSWYEPFPHGKLASHSMGKGALIFELKTRWKNGPLIIASDKTLRAHPCEAWDQTAPRANVGLPFVEIFDVNKWPERWMDTTFDDSDNAEWGHARELDVGDLWPNLVPCDIPRLSEQRLPAARLVSAGEIAPYFDEEDIRLSHEPGEPPIDWVIQMGFSCYRTEFPDLVASWDGKIPRERELKDHPIGLVFDMGKVVSGFIYFEIEVEHAGTRVDVAWGEKLSDKRAFKFPDTNPYRVKYAMQYHCHAGKNTYEMFHWYGFRYIQLNISGPPGKIRVHAVGTNLYLYPVENAGTFTCSDSRLTELYEACRWTLRNCMHDGYEDCPSREQRQWLGDAYVEMMANFALFGDTALVKKLIRQTAQSQRGDGLTEMATPGDSHVHGLIIPDYCFYWISILYQYYRHTGDQALVREMMPSIIKAINWFLGYIDPLTGLLTNLPYWIFIDWSTNDKWGANCPINAQFYHVLRQVGELGHIIGWDTTVAGFENYATNMAKGINTYLWEETRDAYVDAVVVNEDGTMAKKSHKVTFHANSLVLLYEIAPNDRIERVYRAVFDRPYSALYVQNRNPLWAGITAFPLDEDAHTIVAEPFFMHHVNQMFAKLGHYDQILRYLKDGWVKMLDHGATTIWETWGDFGSLCHAWCTTPAYDLATHCLGVHIVEPGAGRAILAPHLFDLSWAEGTVPTIKGPIHVRWEWDSSSQTLTLRYSAPSGVTVEVNPPPIEGKSLGKSTKLKATRDRKIAVQFTYS